MASAKESVARAVEGDYAPADAKRSVRGDRDTAPLVSLVDAVDAAEAAYGQLMDELSVLIDRLHPVLDQQRTAVAAGQVKDEDDMSSPLAIRVRRLADQLGDAAAAVAALRADLHIT